MNTTFKTLILAAAGAALIAASPASAQTTPTNAQALIALPRRWCSKFRRASLDQWQQGEITVNGVDTYGQIRNEYLKDAPSHNGNSY